MPTTLQRDRQTVRIDAGELVGYAVDGHEYVHQKGSPGWRSADTEMFPIIGPTAEADFTVQTPRGPATQDQHGLLRELVYTRTEHAAERAVFEKVYTAGTAVANSKYPAKSTAAQLSWPYDFRFRKTFALSPDALTVTFAIEGEAGMPFMLGYHPAFRLAGAAPTIEACGRTITLDEVLAVGSRALEVAGCSEAVLHDGAHALHLRSEGFGHFMCWTEVRNMVCIEPITFYPYAVAQGELAEGFTTLGDGPRAFSLELRAGA